MVSYAAPLVELLVFFGIIAVLARRLANRPIQLLVFGLSLSVASVLLVSGQPKSGYHFALLVVVLFSLITPRLGVHSIGALRMITVIALLSLGISELLGADWTLNNKNDVPKLFPLWIGLALIGGRAGRLRWLIGSIILLEISISFIVSARGILIGSFAALIWLMINKPLLLKRTVLISMLVGLALSYWFAFPILSLLGSDSVIESSASNFQRAMMNLSTIAYMGENLFTFSETAIFEQAKEYAYAHDAQNLTVHSLFLAFGAYNGLVPALLLWILLCNLVIGLVRKGQGAVAVFLYLYMLLGPDVAETRISLLVCCALGLIHAVAISRFYLGSGFHIATYRYAKKRKTTADYIKCS